MRRLVAILLAVLWLGACGSEVYFDDVVPYPGGCNRLGLEPDVCTALVDEAMTRIGVSTTEVRRVELVSEDRCGDDRELLCVRSLPFIGGVRVTLVDGTIHWTSLACPLGDRPPPAWCPRWSRSGVA